MNVAFWNEDRSVIARAAILVPATMATWWFLLKPASLWMLRVLSWLPLGLLIAPAGLSPIKVNPNTGEWLCNVEVNTTATNRQTGQREFVNSVEIAVRQNDAALFAGGWFCYLALAVSAARFSRKQGKRILWGIAAQTVVNVLGLAAFVYLLGYGTLINSPGGADTRLWLVKYADYLNSLVVPFAGPFLIAMLAHPEWRKYAGLVRPARAEAPRRQSAAARR